MALSPLFFGIFYTKLQTAPVPPRSLIITFSAWVLCQLQSAQFSGSESWKMASVFHGFCMAAELLLNPSSLHCLTLSPLHQGTAGGEGDTAVFTNSWPLLKRGLGWGPLKSDLLERKDLWNLRASCDEISLSAAVSASAAFCWLLHSP